MLLILAAGAAISAGKLADKDSMRNINHNSRVELVNEENHNLDQNALTLKNVKPLMKKQKKFSLALNLKIYKKNPIKNRKMALFKF